MLTHQKLLQTLRYILFSFSTHKINYIGNNIVKAKITLIKNKHLKLKIIK